MDFRKYFSQAQKQANENFFNYDGYDYDEFDEVMEDLDRQLNAKVIDKEKQKRFEMYQKLQKEFQNN